MLKSILNKSPPQPKTLEEADTLIKDLWQLVFSIGAISQAQKPVSGWLQPIYAQIGDAVRRADIAHADETTHYRGGERRWLWALRTPFAIYFMTHYSRGKGAAAELLGEFNGILVSDRYGAYNDHPPESTTIVLGSYHLQPGAHRRT